MTVAPHRKHAKAPAQAAARRWTAPAKGEIQPWKGHKPWERHVVEVAIPVINPMETIEPVINLLRCQTVRPYIVLIDTGSDPAQWEQVQALRGPDVEVHALWTGGLYHSSAVVAAALDLAIALCRTEYLLFSHSDCFLKRRDAVERLLGELDSDCPAAGYGITPRDGIPDWRRMMGHAWSGIHVPSIRKTAARWGHRDPKHQRQDNWDTEYGFNRQLFLEGIYPRLLGYEENWSYNILEDYEHVRSWPLSAMYLPQHHEKAKSWMTQALDGAHQRIKDWTEGEYDDGTNPERLEAYPKPGQVSAEQFGECRPEDAYLPSYPLRC